MGAFEDVARLVLHAGALDETLAQSLTSYYDTALCTTSSRGNHYFGVPLLEEVRGRRSAAEAIHEADQRLLAASLGWLTHRAIDHKLDNELVPKLEQVRQEEGLSEEDLNIDEHQIYEDAIVFREVYDGGRRSTESPHEPLSPATLAQNMRSHPGASAVDVENTELLFGAFWQRNVLQLHRFSKEENDVDAWIDTFLERRQAFSEDLRLYVEAFQNPDPEKMRYYNEVLNTYDRSDPIIRLARALQTGNEPPSIEFYEVLAAAETQSAYARALWQGYRNMQGAADYFNGRMAKDELYDIVDMEQSNRY
jgi:hypothetical protein